MHRLRIEFGGEGDDFLARDQARTIFAEQAGLEVFEIEFGHWRHVLRKAPCSPWRREASTGRFRPPDRFESGGEAEMHHVAVGDDVFLAFQAQLAGVARAGFAAERDIIVDRRWFRRG